MKVGVLTFHNAYNYGAILQAYATQEIVKSYGHEVEIINYQNNAINQFYNNRKFHLRTIPKRRFYKIPGYFIEKYFYLKRRKAFRLFIKHFVSLSSSEYHQGDSIRIDNYDVILIGSDQLWNKKLTGGFDNVYWGDFHVPSHTKKIAWSVCMNEINATEEENKFIIDHLQNFDAISVREKSLQDYLKSLTNVVYPQTLDPTLLLSKEQWKLLCHPVKEENYIAVYAVQNENETIEYAHHIARLLNKKTLIIRSYSKRYFSNENKEYAGPSEFLSYIKNADLVVSTSFHGTVFSLLFQKQFICPIFRNNTRIESLLELAGLKERMVLPNDDIRNLKTIDYNMVNTRLEEVKQKTTLFLNNFLS